MIKSAIVDCCNAICSVRYFGGNSEEKEEILLAGSKRPWEILITV